jgi:beta-lactamase regulating signal transducer with metallopeptidase domain
MTWDIFISSKIVENLGWTLLHSVWQIALAALVLFLLLRAFHSASANLRYLLAVFLLAAAFGLPAATFVKLEINSHSNIFQDSLRAGKNIPSIEKNLPHAEELSASRPIDSQNPRSESAGILDRIESLGNYFSQYFSAVLPFVVGSWLFGVLFFIGRLAGGLWQLHRYQTREISVPDVVWLQRFGALCEKLNIRRSVRLLQSNLVETPVVVGFLKPLVLVPAGVFLQMNPQQLETILAHELIHIRRFDCLINFTQRVAELLFFYHPCLWWISSVIGNEREFAADEAVIRNFGASRLSYASALANLEELRQTARTAPLIAVAANGGSLMQRIQKILQKNTGEKRSASAWSAIVALALIPVLLLTVFSFSSSGFVNVQTQMKNRKLAIGFVALPPVDRTANSPKDADATARLMIAKLTQYKIPAIGFMTGAGVSDGKNLYPVRADIVRLWRDAGFEVGIGGFRHIWFYNTSFEEYVANTEKNVAVAKKILDEKAVSLRYFSYPYLNTGKSVADRDRFESWLKTQGLRSVKYTIDNQEWIYSYAYDMARNDNDVRTMNEIRAAFLDYMSKMFDHYEAYSQEVFGRDVSQTMVLTPSRLVADSADELFGMIGKRGYQFVSMDEAQRDEAYKTPENFIGKAGISWFERWQLARNKKLLEEPEVSELVQKIWDKSRSSK